MPDADEIREQQRQTWDRFAGGWAKWDALISPMMAPVADEMIRSLATRDNGEHLDVAAGTGEPGLSIAARMPGGRVVLTDLSTEMLAEARAKADRLGLRNVEFWECGVDDLEFADASFDSVACRFGLMFFPDIPAAVAEMARVLRPGGRMSLAVWAEAPSNPWATIPMAVIGSEVEVPAPAPNAPGMFRCAEPEMISTILRDAGFRDVAETDVVATLDVASAEEYWALICEVTAPVVAILANVDPDTRARIDAAVLERVRSFEDGAGVRMPARARCVSGTK